MYSKHVFGCAHYSTPMEVRSLLLWIPEVGFKLSGMVNKTLYYCSLSPARMLLLFLIPIPLAAIRQPPLMLKFLPQSQPSNPSFIPICYLTPCFSLRCFSGASIFICIFDAFLFLNWESSFQNQYW